MAVQREKPFRSTSWWTGVALIPLMILILFVMSDYSQAARMFPTLAAWLVLIFACLHTGVGLVAGVVIDDEEMHPVEMRASYRWPRVVYTLWSAGLVAGVWLVGFHIALPVFLVAFLGLKHGRWIAGALMALMMWVFTYLILAGYMNILFPSSVLKRWLIANGYF